MDVTRVPNGRADLETLANEVREAAASGRGSERLRTELGARLAPLISVLRDVVADGDHVCYCADDALHLLPLQAAAHDGEPLVRLASVSRTHGAHVLAQHLGRPPRLPDRYVVFEVPATVDNADPARREVLGKVGAWLAASIKGTRVLAADAADFAALQAADLRDSVVHFATHGVFPAYNARGVAANPYHASGLLLAANKRLPDLDAVERGKAGDHLVSPARLVASKLALNGSHITLQACVSGLAREGIGGDALGLEWALFQLGASSILSTHWNVSAQTSAAFATRFYRRLSQERMSRAAAWRHTVLEFLARPDAASSAYHWSAFSLSGDWR